MDVLYGRRATLPKFLVLELVARVPYQTWEHAAYLSITRHATDTRLARRIYDRVQRAREQQDNEQWHLFILEDVLEHRSERLGWVRYRLLPQAIALVYYHVSWILYVLRPAWSHQLNADFEDHAEHEYMAYVAAHPELADERCTCTVSGDYGCADSLDDVLRQIALDERHHKEESLLELAAAAQQDPGDRTAKRARSARRAAAVALAGSAALVAAAVTGGPDDLRTGVVPWAGAAIAGAVATVLRVVRREVFAPPRSRWARRCAGAAAASAQAMAAILTLIGALALAGVDFVDGGSAFAALATLIGSLATLVVLPLGLLGTCVAALRRPGAAPAWRILPTVAAASFLAVPALNAALAGGDALLLALAALPGVTWAAFALATAGLIDARREDRGGRP